MSIVFRYHRLARDDGTLIDAPYVPVWIKDRHDRMRQFLALIDSGADSSVLPYDMADFLGLKQEEQVQNTAGIGGPVKVRKSKLALTVKNERERYSITIPVLVAQDKEVDIPLILGRNGFFEQFHILFRQDERKITLKKV